MVEVIMVVVIKGHNLELTFAVHGRRTRTGMDWANSDDLTQLAPNENHSQESPTRFLKIIFNFCYLES